MMRLVNHFFGVPVTRERLSTIGASGVVFGYASYLLTRGFFNRSIWEIMTGAVVGVVWGAVLVSSLVPHAGISWEAHACGAVAGVIVAWRLSVSDAKTADASLPVNAHLLRHPADRA